MRQPLIPFAHFMEQALYDPLAGYYMQERQKLGREGDFFTNAHVGVVFGQVLARLFVQWSEQSPKEPWALVEMGGGDGRLAEQVCNTLFNMGIPETQVHMYFVEISGYHQKMQQERLQHIPFGMQWKQKLSDIPRYPFSILYSNELVDAFPVHRLEQTDDDELKEIYMAYDAHVGKWCEHRGPISDPELLDFLSRFKVQLESGQQMEVNLYAKKWQEEIAAWMNQGYVLTIDYGGNMAQCLRYPEGTLRAFRQHQVVKEFTLGEIDITCDVNFEALQAWGQEMGLIPLFCVSQSHFLLQSGILEMYPKTTSTDPFSAEAKTQRAIQQLIHPMGMGERFKVLLQKKEESGAYG